MSSSDTEPLQRQLTVRRTESIPASSRVRHVDQLSEEALTRFLEVVEAARLPSARTWNWPMAT
ncbi:hypothetical protein ACFQMM_05710 [Saliphagus sp. GCM10025308]